MRRLTKLIDTEKAAKFAAEAQACAAVNWLVTTEKLLDVEREMAGEMGQEAQDCAAFM